MIEPLDLIRAIRESFGASIAVYSLGNCYQFYEILKVVFPDAEAHYDGNHVYTKINGEYYDIRGKHDHTKKDTPYDFGNKKFIPLTDDIIKSLSVNKWSDERRDLEG